jgi:class 3 adenylate cyclase
VLQTGGDLPEMTATCRLATILNADVVGYSHLMGADESTLILAAIHRLATDRPSFSGLITAGEEGMLERLKAHRREVVDPKITEHRGRILKTTSDGMIVEFTNPVEAVRCAVEMQQSMAERNARTAADKRLTFRIAIDLGNVATDEAVSISTRLRALAEPGGICISRAVLELVRDKLPYAFEDIGEHSVKNMAVPVQAYSMSTGSVASAPRVTAQRSPASGQHWVSPRSAVIAASVAVTVGICTAAWWSWLGRNSSNAPIQALGAAKPPAPQVIGNASERRTQAPSASEQAQSPPGKYRLIPTRADLIMRGWGVVHPASGAVPQAAVPGSGPASCTADAQSREAHRQPASSTG